MNFDKLKQEYQEKLENAKVVLDEIESLSYIFEKNDLEKLKNIRYKNEILLQKIKEGIIEVAIIGGENDGKSTLANALVKLKEAFPTGEGRVTYTSTVLKYGEDKAIIEFFTYEEFNEIVNEMLSNLKYHKKVDFKSFTLEELESYLDLLRKNDIKTYNQFYPTIGKELKVILQNKNAILQYLNRNKKVLSKDEIGTDLYRGYITDPKVASAVKKIEIQLSDFKDTKEIVIYDVPGFTSPTKKHKEETKKALNKADTILLVKSLADKLEIQSYDIEMLNSYEDVSFPLNEKLFCVGTKISRLDSKEDALRVMKKFKEICIDELKVKESRVFIVDSKNYLDKVVSNLEIDKKLKEWHLEEVVFNVDKLRDSIKEFYKNEAFRNLKLQIDNILSEIRKILSKKTADIKEIDKELMLIKKEEMAIALKVRNRIDKLTIELAKLQKELEEDILKNRPFSEELRNKIDAIVDEVKSESLEELNVIESLGEINTQRPNAVNQKYRETLSPKIKKEFIDKVLGIADEKHQEYFNKMIDAIIKALELNEELRSNVEEFVKKFLKDISYKRESYLFLADKFTDALITTVVKNPRGSEDRKNTFEEFKEDLYSLAIYCENNLNNIELNNLSLIKKILGKSEVINNSLYSGSRTQTNTTTYQVAKTLQEVEKEIKEDLELIKETIKKGVIKAIFPERPFVSIFAKQFKFLADTKREEVREKWSKFLLENYELLVKNDLKNIEPKKEKLEDMKNTLLKVDKLLKRI